MHTLPLFYMPILSKYGFKVEVVIYKMAETEYSLQMGADTRPWYIQST